MWVVSLAGKKSRRLWDEVVEKFLCDVVAGVVLVATRRRPTTVEEEGQQVLLLQEEEEVERRGATARVNWAVCLSEQSLVFARVVNI